MHTKTDMVQACQAERASRPLYLAHLLLACLPLPRQCHLHFCSFGDPQARSGRQPFPWGYSLEHLFETSSFAQCAAVPGSLRPLQK